MSVGAFGQSLGEPPKPSATTRTVSRSNGVQVEVTDGAISLPPFSHHETWNVQDAAKIRHYMVTFFGSPQGVSLMDVFSHRMWEVSQVGRSAPYPGAILAMAMRSSWSSPDFTVTFAEHAFGQMMMAAASAAPDDIVVHGDELLSESGVIFFEQALPLNEVGLWEDGDIDPIRAVSWTAMGAGQTFFTLWSDGASSFVAGDLTVETDRIPYLSDEGFLTYHLGSPATDPDSGVIVALVKSVMAISRSEHARRQDVKAVKPRKLRPEYRDVPIRRVYLSHPEYGEAELAGARGKPHRLHWVRGHWRKQWFPKHEEHRTIWIDGHPRGNKALGTVGGDKVYIAVPTME